MTRRALCLLLGLVALPSARPRILTVNGWDLQLHHNPALKTPQHGDCTFFVGQVLNHNNSHATLTECEGNLYGLVQVDEEVFAVQPNQGEHQLRRRDVTVVEHLNYFNLTGDTLELDLNFSEDDDPPKPHVFPRHRHTTEQDYFRDILPVTRPVSGVQELWMEIAVVADHSMLKFHGRQKLVYYVLALMNIVSVIFNDPSLGANMTLVINQLSLFDEPTSFIKPGNFSKSLEGVNRWNYRHLRKLPEDIPGWDAAVWLTREKLGGPSGPSGYASTDGICTKERSGTVVRDEGFTSAFVVAHELGHMLGLRHDGIGDCESEHGSASVMAQVVPNTLHHFSWSACSRRVFHKKIRGWYCLHERASDKGVQIIGADALRDFVFTMDEQCRSQFGDGFTVCKTIKQRSPCWVLRCAHRRAPLACHSKAPPMEGTPCGKNHWCVNRMCVPMPGNTTREESSSLSQQPTSQPSSTPRSPPSRPAWDEWGPWSDCQSDCGYGLKTRNRECRVNGVRQPGACEGASTQGATCFAGRPCAGFRDIRMDLCRRHDDKYMPYVPRKGESVGNCDLQCMNYTGGEPQTFSTLPDGAPCSYDRPYDLCYQGTCVQGQCSSLDPICSWCSDGYCNNITRTFTRQVGRGWKRLAVISHSASQLSVHLASAFPLSIAIEEKRRDRPKIKLTPLSKPFTIKADEYLKYSMEPQSLRFVEVDKHVIELKEERVGREGAVAAAGAVLEWQQTNTEVYLTVRSQLQSELMIWGSLESPNTKEEHVTVEVTVTYSTPSTPARRRPKQHRWLRPKRGPCSVSCGGGVRIVKTKCLHEGRCQPTRTERCNTFPCEFAWTPGPWEECSATCGDHGVQERQLYCVPKYEMVSSQHSRVLHSVSPALCTSERPATLQPCNQIPCPVYWQKMPWTPCSATCGRGWSRQPVYCPSPNEELCGPRPVARTRRCKMRRCAYTACTAPDVLRYCELFTADLLKRYCLRTDFRYYCCSTCRQITNV